MRLTIRIKYDRLTVCGYIVKEWGCERLEDCGKG